MELSNIVIQVFETYRAFQEIHPVVGSVLTAEVTFSLGDVASQLITDKKVDWKKVRYTASLAPFYGVASYALMKSGDLVGEYVVNHPLAKAALGPNLWGNVFNTFFFVNNTIGEKGGYNLKNLCSHYWNLISTGGKNFKEQFLANIPVKEYLYATAATFTVWNAFQWWNYASVPTELQTPACLAAGVGWLVLLSCWSLSGRRKIVEKKVETKQIC